MKNFKQTLAIFVFLLVSAGTALCAPLGVSASGPNITVSQNADSSGHAENFQVNLYDAPNFSGQIIVKCFKYKTTTLVSQGTLTAAGTVGSAVGYVGYCNGLTGLTNYSYEISASNGAFTPSKGEFKTLKEPVVRTGGDTFALSGSIETSPSSSTRTGFTGGFRAAATVSFKKPITNVNYDVQLGYPTADQTGCIISPTLNATGGAASTITSQTAKYSGDGSDFTITKVWEPIRKGTYCLGIEKEDKPFSNNYITAMGLLTGSMFTVGAEETSADPADLNSPNAYGCVSNGTSNYCMLAPLPIPDAQGHIDPTGNIDVQQGVGSYINGIIKLVMGLIMVLAVFMIVVGGIEYMSTVSIGEKEGAKDRIVNALLGLVLALGSFIILNTINPDLTDVKITVPVATLTLDFSQSEGDDGLGVGAGEGELGNTTGEGGLKGQKVKNAGGAELTACNSAGLTNVKVSELDQGMGIFKQSGDVQVNAAVRDSLIAGFKAYKVAVDAKPSLKEYKIKTMGGYSCRGAVGKKTVYSGHAFGLAVDINAATNSFTKGAIITDLPTELVTALKGAGFGWGGEWRSAKDAMHFSKLHNEKGKGVDSYTYEK